MSTAQPEWRTSSWSSNGTNCVEVFHDLAALRDSKHPTGAVLRVDVRGLVAFGQAAITPVTTKSSRLATETVWSAKRS